MEERARRARWIKTELEPDAGMPMIIDYINSPLGDDNAIWHTYTGGGYYAGFVIDCDATLIHQVAWAWNSPGGQWWTLRLRPVEELVQFLDNYLADPPMCYDPGTPGLRQEREAPPEGSGGATVLIVDDDEGLHYESYFKVPIGNLKIHYDVWDTLEDGSPDAVTLAAYSVVVWLTGDADEQTLTATDQSNLTEYLEGGGNLFISGQDIGKDIGETTFYREYLHAALIDDDAGVNYLIGKDLLTGIDVSFRGWDGEDNQLTPSRIELMDDARGIFRYDDVGSVSWAGLRWAGHYNVAYLAFGFEGIGDLGAGTSRYEIMKRLFAWFDVLPCPSDLDFDHDTDLDDFEIFARSMGGPDETDVPAGADFMQFAKSDLDVDKDVDLADFADFQRRFGVLCD